MVLSPKRSVPSTCLCVSVCDLVCFHHANTMLRCLMDNQCEIQSSCCSSTRLDASHLISTWISFFLLAILQLVVSLLFKMLQNALTGMISLELDTWIITSGNMTQTLFQSLSIEVCYCHSNTKIHVKLVQLVLEMHWSSIHIRICQLTQSMILS